MHVTQTQMALQQREQLTHKHGGGRECTTSLAPTRCSCAVLWGCRRDRSPSQQCWVKIATGSQSYAAEPLPDCVWCMFGAVVQILWAFCVYVEAVSVFPQLRMMQKAKVVERFTAHYVFALGLSRFLSCAHWVLQVRTHARARRRARTGAGAGRGGGGTPCPCRAPHHEASSQRVERMCGVSWLCVVAMPARASKALASQHVSLLRYMYKAGGASMLCRSLARRSWRATSI